MQIIRTEKDEFVIVLTLTEMCHLSSIANRCLQSGSKIVHRSNLRLTEKKMLTELQKKLNGSSGD